VKTVSIYCWSYIVQGCNWNEEDMANETYFIYLLKVREELSNNREEIRR
jgi:hypothetical protein